MSIRYRASSKKTFLSVFLTLLYTLVSLPVFAAPTTLPQKIVRDHTSKVSNRKLPKVSPKQKPYSLSKSFLYSNFPEPVIRVSIHGSIKPMRFRTREVKPPFNEVPVFWIRADTGEEQCDLSFGTTDTADSDTKKSRAIADFPSLMDEVSNYLNQHKGKDLIFFVHGCCINFDKAYKRSSQIAMATGQPVFLYSWPSVPMKFTPSLNNIASDFGYNRNEAAYDASKSDFGRFFHSFEERLNEHSRMILVAHSMGNRFIDSELELRYLLRHNDPDFKKFKATIFACADVDAKAFISHKKRIASNSDQTWLVVNDKDKALKQSVRVHGGSRLGNPHEKILLLFGEGIKVVETTEAQNDKHDLPIEIISALLNPNFYPQVQMTELPDTRVHVKRFDPVYED